MARRTAWSSKARHDNRMALTVQHTRCFNLCTSKIGLLLTAATRTVAQLATKNRSRVEFSSKDKAIDFRRTNTQQALHATMCIESLKRTPSCAVKYKY